MLTSKQRSRLKSIISAVQPIAHIGKEGVTANVVKSLDDALEAHEVIKVAILETAGDDPWEVAREAEKATGAELVTVIGRKAIFYRRSSRENFVHLEF